VHLSLEKSRKTYYDMFMDVHTIIMLDKESTRIDQRWKIIAVFNGG
jgi:hypothetical protein